MLRLCLVWGREGVPSKVDQLEGAKDTCVRPPSCRPRSPPRSPPRGKEEAALQPGGSRPGRDLSEGSGRGPRKTPGERGPGASQSLTQQQQLELAARVLLVPAKLPLDLRADALRLLLLRRQAAAAGHGARCTRRRDAVPGRPDSPRAARPADPRQAPAFGKKADKAALTFRVRSLAS